MPENWNIYKLGDLIEHQKGFAFKSKWYQDSGAIIVRVSDTTDNSIDVSTCNKIDKDLAGAYERFKIQFNDIVIATVGSWPPNYASVVGKVIKVPQEADGSLLNQNAVRLRTKNPAKFDQKFIYYLMKSDTFLQYIVNSAQGSANQASIKLTDIFNFPFSLPNISEQKSIASILSALDDKIELNLRMNKTLEEMAMALYKHWFVDFGPFQDGEFVDSELGEIPKGWEVKRLDEFALKKSETFNFKNKEDVVFVNTGDVQEGRFLHSNRVPKKGLPGQAKKAIAKGDILYSEIRPKNKRFAYVNFDSEDYVVSTKFMIINPKDNILSKLLYRILTMQSTVDNLNSIAEGRSGTFPQITFDAISDLKFILPPFNIQQKFQEIVSPMEMQQDELYLENQILTQLRDTFLPKLISGEVRVKDVEKTLSEVL